MECQHEFRVVPKTFYLVESPEAGSGQATPEPTERPGAEVEPGVKTAAPASASSPMRASMRSKGGAERIVRAESRTGHGFLYWGLVGVVLTAGYYFWQGYDPGRYRQTLSHIQGQYEGLITSIHAGPPIDAQARELLFKGRAESVFDTQTHYENAVAFYRQAVTHDEGFAAAHGALAEAAAELAEIFAQSGQPVEAQPWLEEALRSGTRAMTLDPTTLEAHRGLAAYERLNGRFGEAQELLDKGLQQQPENVEVLLAMGRLYLSKQDVLDLAERYLGKAKNLDESSIRVNRYWAVLQERQGHLKEALHHWQKVLDLSPDHPIAAVEVGRLQALLRPKTLVKTEQPVEPKPE